MSKKECKKCNGTKYTNKKMHSDGSATFTMCECSGITKEKLEAFAERLGSEEASYNFKTDTVCPPHSWDRSGERCEKCGDKDWMT